ncbi:hypothetical protein NQ318_023153 [Aromia moschata]|uniref:Uncharacterized protein n=1 Tax=Aromia moschata TaxID=1265417 RepID=A0AAV8X2Q9_9CUCU|nr:hypothetical protein NQ318_023153 [Aromia moschata]
MSYVEFVGTRFRFRRKAVPIPILLIQRPGKKTRQNIGYGSGWDIIMPSEWAQTMWVSDNVEQDQVV